jgi:hypothetical protein
MAVVEKSLINHGITLGEKKEIDSLGNNPMSVNGQAPPSSGKSYWV